MSLSHAREHLLLVLGGNVTIDQRVAVPPLLQTVFPGTRSGHFIATTAGGEIGHLAIAFSHIDLHLLLGFLEHLLLLVVVLLDDDKETKHDAKDDHQDTDLLESGAADEQHRTADGDKQQRVGQTAPNHQGAIDADG